MIHKDVNGAKKLPIFLILFLTKSLSITVKRWSYKTKLGSVINTELVKSY